MNTSTSKYTIALCLTTLVSTVAWGQSESTTVTQTEEKKQSEDFSTTKKYKYIDRNFIEEKRLVSLGIEKGLTIAFEQKISTSSSLRAGIFSDFLMTSTFDEIGLFAGYRYYYSSRRKVKNGEKTNNLNGSYLAAEYRYLLDDFDDFYTGNNIHDFGIRWGIQQRLGRYGIIGTGLSFDFSPGMERDPFGRKNWFRIISTFNLALAAGNLERNKLGNTSYLSRVHSKWKNITTQLNEDKSLLKVGLRTFNIDAEYLRIGGLLAFERKLNPQFSILGEIVYDVFSSDYQPFVNLNYSLNTGFRYYYSLNKRIRRGLSANNFSANYITMAADVSPSSTIIIAEETIRHSTSDRNHTGVFLGWGVQRKIKRAGFVDFTIGLKYGRRNISSYQSEQVYDYSLESDIRLVYGFAK